MQTTTLPAIERLQEDVLLPILSSRRFADLVGLPLGVIEAQMDRRILPVFRLGKRRMVNLEALRAQAIKAAEETTSTSK